MFVLVNCKTYPCDPVEIGRAVAAVDERAAADVAVAPPTSHVDRVADTGAETWVQHVDPVSFGSNTGHTLAESVESVGAAGTILNHSERRLGLAALDEAIDAASRAGLRTIACGNDPTQVAAAASLGPDAVAVEPPELIGTGTPVSKADPSVVSDAVAAVEEIDPDVPVLCGAGIGGGEDVVAARELGAAGVLLASGVAKADDPGPILASLVEPL